MARRHSATGDRVERIQTFALHCRLPESLGWAQGRFVVREALLVRIETHNGAVGWGECAGPPLVAQAAIHSVYAPLLMKRDGRGGPQNIWHDLFRATQPWGRRGMMVAALSGIDMALWDLRGRLLGLSACELMGGRLRDRVPCYATGLYFRDRPETELVPLLVEEAHGYIEAGYRAVKAQLGRNLSSDTALLRALRKALPQTILIADACRAYDLPEALQIGRVLEEMGFAMIEEPLSPEQPALYRRFAETVRVPVGCGESSQTRWDFAPLIEMQAVALLQPDLAFCGGPTEALHIRSLASAHGLNVSPCVSGTQFNLAAALHFLASDFRQPGRQEAAFSQLGQVAIPDPLRDAIFSQPVEIDSGLAHVPTQHGLGVTIDETEMQSFCVSTQETRI